MTAADRQALKGVARKEFADCMLGIILACDQCSWLLARVMRRI